MVDMTALISATGVLPANVTRVVTSMEHNLFVYKDREGSRLEGICVDLWRQVTVG